MPSLIMVVPKPNVNKQKSAEFFNVIDQYIKSQGWSILDDIPKTYFIQKNIPPTSVRDYIKVIKSTQGFKDVISAVYFAPSLQKA